ncbi:MAG: hypothetical protein ACR2H6_05610 [Pyrinomonadaceae bacterium]
MELYPRTESSTGLSIIARGSTVFLMVVSAAAQYKQFARVGGLDRKHTSQRTISSWAKP